MSGEGPSRDERAPRDQDAESTSLGPRVSDDAVRGMVGALTEDWRVEAIDRVDLGTDFVATLDVRTPGGSRRAVLKATTADLVAPEVARAEPRLLELVGRETGIPVPGVYGSCDAHPDYPAPFYLMEHVDGENTEGRYRDLPTAARERVVREAGRNLAALHDLGPLPAVGRLGVDEGELTVLDTDDHPSHDEAREAALDHYETTLDALAEGGYFPEKTDDPDRFADLAPDLRRYLREKVPEMPEPAPPTYCHHDYRYGNLLVDPDTGETRAVLDWANCTADDPANNLAVVGSHLFDQDEDGEDRAEELRRVFRDAYADARDAWTFDDAIRERMRLYRLGTRLDAMACLPLWYEDATPERRDERAAEHRAFVDQFL